MRLVIFLKRTNLFKKDHHIIPLFVTLFLPVAAQLNALACQTRGKGTMTGQVLVNGRPFGERDFRHWGVYVMQAEPLLATATVRGQGLLLFG